MGIRLIAIVLFIGGVRWSDAQVASTGNCLQSGSVITLTPEEIMRNPEILKDIRMVEAIPLTYYTEADIAHQKLINTKAAEAIVTWFQENEKREWIDIDHEEITPYTWKWVHMEMAKPNGSVTKISLRRPNWWVKNAEADIIGSSVYLQLPEMGVQGWAAVTRITPSLIDTRVWEGTIEQPFVSRPITGRFIHESDNVYDLYFQGSTDSLGVTGTHPIWSLDRNEWVAANELRIGENLKTYKGKVVLTRKQKREGRHTVYTLEVYRDHNFFVSDNSILVHNECWNKHWDDLLGKINQWKQIKKQSGLPSGAGNARSSEAGGVYRRLYEHATIDQTFGPPVSFKEMLTEYAKGAFKGGNRQIIMKADLTNVSKEEIERMSKTAKDLEWDVEFSEYQGVKYMDMSKYRDGLN